MKNRAIKKTVVQFIKMSQILGITVIKESTGNIYILHITIN